MKTTPFQQILKNEMSRLESIVYSNTAHMGGQIALSGYKPTKKKSFLLQLFGLNISLS